MITKHGNRKTTRGRIRTFKEYLRESQENKGYNIVYSHSNLVLGSLFDKKVY